MSMWYPTPGPALQRFNKQFVASGDRRRTAVNAPISNVVDIRPVPKPDVFDWAEDVDVARMLPTFSTDLEASVVIADIKRCGSDESKRIVGEWEQRVRSQRCHPSVFVESDPCGEIPRPGAS